jgi:membrane associated rhomboid family serine protease
MIPIRDNIRSRSVPIVTWLIIAANVLVFFYESSMSTRQLDGFLMQYGLVPAQLVVGKPLAVVAVFTSIFLHGGWLHLISNMWALFIFGDNVEDRMGPGRYLTFYLVCGVAANLAQVFVDPASRLPGIGASGAIAGVLAAYLVLFPRARVLTLVPIFFFGWFMEFPAIVYLGFWFASQFFTGLLSLGSSLDMGGIAYWAHIGGFITGLLLVKRFARRAPMDYGLYPAEYRR